MITKEFMTVADRNSECFVGDFLVYQEYLKNGRPGAYQVIEIRLKMPRQIKTQKFIRVFRNKYHADKLAKERNSYRVPT